MWGYETQLHTSCTDSKFSLTIPASHRISTFFLFLVTTFCPSVSSSSLMSICVWKHGRPLERRDKDRRHLRCHASTSLKRACLSLYWQALKMRLKSLGTCYLLINREMERRQDVTCCDAAWHPSAGSIHHPKPSHSIGVIDISEQYVRGLKSLKHETLCSAQILQKCRSEPEHTFSQQRTKSGDCRIFF